MSGGSGLENLYVVDGVNITNAGYGALGSYSIVFGSLGNGVPFDFVKETQVKTGGYEAEYGQATGGVVNVVTKSGTNALRGSAIRLPQAGGVRERLRPGDDGERHRERRADAEQRYRRRSRRRDRAESRCSSSAPSIRSGSGRTYVAPEGFPLRSLGDVNQDRRIIAVRGQGYVADGVGPPPRRLVLRRPGIRRQRAAAIHGAAQDRHVRLQPARPLRRPQPDGALRWRDHAELADRGIVRAGAEHRSSRSRRSTSGRWWTTR